jgi:hypothetical protein
MDEKKKCDCHGHEQQVCEVCQGCTGREKDAPAPAGGEVAERLEWLRPRVSAMKSRYPKELNIEGLEPALTSDIMEIVAAAEARVRAEVWGKARVAIACSYNPEEEDIVKAALADGIDITSLPKTQ